MCINCNLLTPVTDEFADFLGVEKRKYLTIGHDTYYNEKDADGNMKTIMGTTNNLYNYYTLDFFRVDTNSFKTLEVNIKSNSENPKDKTIVLYEGKIKMIRPFPKNLQKLDYMKNLNRDELYLECFDLSDVQEMFGDDTTVPPVDVSNPLSYMSNKYVEIKSSWNMYLKVYIIIRHVYNAVAIKPFLTSYNPYRWNITPNTTQ